MNDRSPKGYDEPGSRTKFAWIRTGLVLVAVNALIARGLHLRDAPSWLYAIVVLEVLVFATLAVIRFASLGPWESPGVSARLVVSTATTVVAMCLVAALCLGLLLP